MSESLYSDETRAHDDVAGSSRKQPSNRVFGIDVARAVAITGMACIHFLIIVEMFGIESATITQILRLLSGRPATMFMILAGVGIGLRCLDRDRDKTHDISRSLRRRGMFFLLVGMLNVLWWDGDILRVYGVSYLVASFCLQSSNRRILIFALSAVFIFLGLLAIFDFEQNWDFANLSYKNIWTLQGALLNLFFIGFRAVFPWIGLMFLGIWIGRRDLRDRRLANGAIVIGLVIWALAEITSTILVKKMLNAYPELDREIVIALVGTESLPALPLFLLSSGGMMVATIFVCVQICERYRESKMVEWLAAAGRMAFTWYILHIAFVLGFAGICIAFGPLPAVYGPVVSGGFVVLILVVSSWYLKKYKVGPLEWVLRRIADGKPIAR